MRFLAGLIGLYEKIRVTILRIVDPPQRVDSLIADDQMGIFAVQSYRRREEASTLWLQVLPVDI